MTRYMMLVLGLVLAWGCGGSSEGSGTGGSPATGGAAGAATGGAAGMPSGGAAGSGGTSGTSCTSLTNQYASAIAAAKKCSVGSTTACDGAADTSIAGCGYYTNVDKTNADALKQLESLQQEFKAQACPMVGGCALGGWGPTMPATCEGTGGTGSCS